MSKTLTIDEVRRELRVRGLSVAQWARSQGFSKSQVYAVLSGRTKGLRGAAHEVAKALNLKPQPNHSVHFECLDIGEGQNSAADFDRGNDVHSKEGDGQIE